MLAAPGLSWFGTVRLGLVQTALGAIVVLATSTLNRVMVVELALPAALPGTLIALHYAMQVLRPRFGFGSDMGRRRTPWIIGGMGMLAAGGIAAAIATAVMASHLLAGIILAVVAFTMIGLGVGACGTSLLVLLATRVEDRRRGAAATCVWIMMIAGFALTAAMVGHWLDPFSFSRLVGIASGVCATALVTTLLAVWGIEKREAAFLPSAPRTPQPTFATAIAEVWAEPNARRFAIFVFLSMLAYGGQDLVLDPFAGRVFGLTPGGSTKLSGLQHGGVFLGMILVGFLSGAARRREAGALQAWAVGGCVGSATSLVGLAASGFLGLVAPLRAVVFILGVTNGIYAVAAIGSMMTLVDRGRSAREGVRMGLWGAAQATAFGLGGLLCATASDAARRVFGSSDAAYSAVFAGEAALFLVAAVLASRLNRGPARVERPAGCQPQATTLRRELT